MNFTSDCLKDKSKLQQDFYFDSETPRGHFFAVLDFASHDYANLNPSLKGKLETIVSSFVSLSSFSADLFLRFMEKEINNFVHNLAEQSGGPELLCSAGLCLVSGSRLSYIVRGDMHIRILNGGRFLPPGADKLGGVEPKNGPEKRLGTTHLETPIAGQVEALTLQDDDVILIMTRNLAEAVESRQLPADLNVREQDSKLICSLLMKTGGADGEGGTLVVISGPYEGAVEPGLAALSKSVALLEARLNTLAETERLGLDVARSETGVDQLEQKFGQPIAELKDALTKKAAAIDLLELDERVKSLNAMLAAKADTAEVLELKRDVLKLGVASNAENLANSKTTVAQTDPPVSSAIASLSTDNGGDTIPASAQPPRAASTFSLKAALIILVISLAAGFLGGWLALRRKEKGPEVWSVRTSGNQISISRQDGSNGGIVTLTVTQPLKSTGNQIFSSFADVQRYISMITSVDPLVADASQATPPTSADNQGSNAVTEITVKPGDSLKKLAELYNVPREKLMQLNPGITRWSSIQAGQKIVVPSANLTPAPPVLSAQANQSPTPNGVTGNTTEVTLAPGDSLNELVRRFNTTPERLKELNPQITNWARIQPGQKVVVPTPAG